jgi:serine phosphatase RsbU (regulator of sigma subunit)
MTRPTSDRAAVNRSSLVRLHRVPAAVLAVLFILSLGVVVATRAVVRDQESRLLTERANEVSLVLGTAISSDEATLAGLGHIARDGGDGLFTKEAAEALVGGAAGITFGLLRPGPGAQTPDATSSGPTQGFVVVAEAGDGLSVGQRISGAEATIMSAALKHTEMVATPVLGSGAGRQLGFALGGTDAPTGTVVYRQDDIGALKAPREAGTAPFHELSVALYDAPKPDPAQLVVTTTRQLPLRGEVLYLPFAVGTSHWALAVSSPQPLVGTIAAWSPWVALAVGVVGSVLVGSVLEQAVRRRDAAMALYWSEHHVAETLQHRLLPSLSAMPGLDVAARYVAASDGQQVGGDWFDVFDLGEAKTGVVIGDVMGHDIEAAAAMAQVRAGLRAYALEGGEPAPVVERLAHLVDAFSVTGLVTVVYGVLGPPDEKGARRFCWANAGHPPPFVCLPDRQVQELREGSSSIIGAPGEDHRAQGERILPAGSLLVLYTDGLVERPGTALTDSIEQLRARLQQRSSATSADDVCDAILRAKAPDQTRDDIAIVVVRLTAPAGKAAPAFAPGALAYAQALHNPSMSRR